MNYRIKEDIFEDGRHSFVPQYIFNDVNTNNEKWKVFYNSEYKHDLTTIIKFDNKEEAFEYIKIFRRRYMIPIEEKIHELNF